MSIRLRQWIYKEDGKLPEPDLLDDREEFPAALVKNILEWLDAEKVKHLANHAPTNQLITPYEGTRFLDPVTDKPTATEQVGGFGAWEFESGTAEILLRHKSSQMILVRYNYMTAREIKTNKFIVGPPLWVKQEERLIQ
jgi:hypothetical protein